MPVKRLDGRVYEEVLVRGVPGYPLPVDLGGASIDATIEDVQIGNTDENPVPVTDASGSLTVDSPELTSIDGKLPTLSNGAVPVAPSVDQGGGAVTSTTTRVTLASDSPGIASLSSIDSKLAAPRTPTTTSVASSATSVTILSSNANRRGVSITNDSTATLRLSFSNPAATNNAFIVLQPGSFLLLDQQLIVTNAIYGIWNAVNGAAQITEYV